VSGEPPARTRPIAATLVVVMALVWGAVLAANGVIALGDARNGDASTWPAVSDLLFACLAVLVAVGAFRVARWGWVLFMTWAVWALTVNLLRVFVFGDPQYLPLVVATLTVFMLTPLDVQVAFGVRNAPNVRLGSSRNPLDRV